MLANDSGGSLLSKISPDKQIDTMGNITQINAVKEVQNMVKVTITAACKGSADGISIRNFQAGETVTLPEFLANHFIDIKTAVPYAEPKAEIEEPHKEAEKPQPSENKAVQPTDNKKRGRPRG